MEKLSQKFPDAQQLSFALGSNEKWNVLSGFQKYDRNSYNVLDLFCGCGGLSLGFERAGFNIVAGVDSDEAALNTYRYNFPNAFGLNVDVSKKNWIKNLKQISAIDVLLAGPPCQGFSLTGTRDPEDPRNSLYKSVFDAAREFNPKVILIENVKGMATLYEGEALRGVLKAFEKLGYNVDYGILNSANYCVPQSRERLFFLASKSHFIQLPKPMLVTDNYITCGEAIADLPPLDKDLGAELQNYQIDALNLYQQLMRDDSKSIFNHIATNHTELVKRIISLVPEGKNYKSLPKGVGENRRFNEAWTRYDSNKPSRTIDTGHRNHFHYKYNRVPTVRENARLQSFPDNFIFCGTKTQQGRQVGNAVPVFLSQAIAMTILKLIK